MTEYSPSRAVEPDPDVQSFLDLYNGLDVPELLNFEAKASRFSAVSYPQIESLS